MTVLTDDEARALSQSSEDTLEVIRETERAVIAKLAAGAPIPDHTALLNQALEALRMPCARWNKQQTLIVNAAIAAIEGALK